MPNCAATDVARSGPGSWTEPGGTVRVADVAQALVINRLAGLPYPLWNVGTGIEPAVSEWSARGKAGA
jgi:hypothetical protein